MRIGFYCGLANNMYVFARELAGQGVDVCFIRDRSDRYPMSQPAWEDIAFPMKYEEVPRAASWTWDQWSRFEKKLDWTAPKWLYDPLTALNVDAPITPFREQGSLDSWFIERYVRVQHRGAALEKMRACDALLVSGVEGCVLANASGRPYVIWPFGGDLMIAAGHYPPPIWQLRSAVEHAMVRRQLVEAYAGAVCIGAHEPSALLTDFYGTEHFLRNYKVARIPIPFSIRQRPDKTTRRLQLGRLLQNMGVEIPQSRYVGFVPSRVDYEWKGQDRLLRALSRLNRDGKATDIHLVFSGWGKDFDLARRLVHESGLENQITFLDSALSKPLLYQFYLSTDFVVDQFIIGMCGTSSLEAMACGAPVMMWVNTAAERPWGYPPVLAARTEEEIAGVLSDLSDEVIDLESTGRALQEWVSRNYSSAAVAAALSTTFSRF